MATVDTLNLEVKTNSEQAAQGIKNLTKALNTLYRNVQDGTKISKLSQQLAGLNTALDSISYANVRKTERLAKALQTISQTNVAIRSAANSLRQVASTDADDITHTPATGDSSGGGNTRIRPVRDTEQQNESYRRLQKSLTGLANQFRKSVAPVLKFVRALGRVAFYRAVRFILKSIVDGLKEGIKNLAEFSAGMNGLDSSNANGVLSQYKSEFLYFKNAIATAVMPVLAMFVNGVSKAINVAVDFINIIAQITSALNGQTTFTKAKFVMVDYADSLDKASGSAKALNKQLAGFDELNNLTTNSGGGGGVTKTPSANDMFTDPNMISDKWIEVANKLKEKFDLIKLIAGDIAVAILGWKVGSALAGFIASWLNMPLVKSLTLTLGFSLALSGMAIEIFNFADAILGGDWSAKNILGVILGILGQVAGGVLIGLATVGGTVAGVVGGIIGLLVGIVIAQIGVVLDVFINGWNKVNAILGVILYVISPVTGVIVALIGSIVKGILWLLENIRNTNTWVGKLTSAEDKFIAKIGEVVPALKPVCDWILKFRDNIMSAFEKVSDFVQKIKDLITEFRNLKNAGGFTFSGGLDWVKNKLQGFADGGYPSRGDLFIANESGAEMVGSLNGRTAVANNDDIAVGIANACYSAMSKALMENGGTIRIEGDPNGMFKVMRRQATEYTNRTGRSAFV